MAFIRNISGNTAKIGDPETTVFWVEIQPGEVKEISDLALKELECERRLQSTSWWNHADKPLTEEAPDAQIDSNGTGSDNPPASAVVEGSDPPADPTATSSEKVTSTAAPVDSEAGVAVESSSSKRNASR